jgi:tRNA-2-methylthio-N6-dimethylallyladenosine synthase
MPHLHLPLQSGSDRVLASMNREYTWAIYKKLIDRARELMPHLAVSTDMIVGYPGETEDDFQATVRALKEIRYDSAFLFKYSPRQGTVAAGYVDDVSLEEKQRRLALVIETQRGITDERSARFVGQEVEVLVDGTSPRDQHRVVGKTREFKSTVFPGQAEWIGTLRRLRVTETRGVTLFGEPIEPAAVGAA